MAKLALASPPLPVIRILLVEDNPSDAFVLSELLSQHNRYEYQISSVSTQAKAIATLAKHNFDVCLLDLTLPDANGFSALINLQEKAPDLPILIITGYNDTSMAKRAVGRGAQDYLRKGELNSDLLTRAIDYAMERHRLGKALFQRANYDSLTSLTNRDMFLSRLRMAMARADRFNFGIAILFIDLDGFKPINDSYGHDTGDEVLKIVAERIRQSLRTYDTPARFGGDEFLVLLEGISSPHDAALIAQKVLKSFTAPVAIQGQKLTIGASIGIVFSNTPITAEALLQQADTAMYEAKKNGGNCYHFYAADLDEEVASRLIMEQHLRDALSANTLQLYYQPFVNPDGDAVMGVEALLRWKHMEQGLLSAHEFLSIAEKARMMPDLGRWLCAQLHQDILKWAHYDLPPLRIAVNLSASQLDADDVIAWFETITQDEALGAHQLAVEIDEEALASLSKLRFTTLAKFCEMGIALHLDHFGRGTFSLTTLHSLPFSLLKLDMSLIQNLGNEVSGDAILHAAIMLAHHLGIKVEAVGVEAPWQAQALKDRHCDVMQGFLTMQPMTSDQIIDWLQSTGQ